MEVKYSTDPKIRELQERTLALGKQIADETKSLEAKVEAEWEAKTRKTDQERLAIDIFSTT